MNNVNTNVFFPNVWIRWGGNHAQEDLAKFGYNSKGEVKKLGLFL